MEDRNAATHGGVDIQVLNLGFKLVHDSRDFLEVHAVQSFVQGLGDLAHIFGHLTVQKCMQKFIIYQQQVDCKHG